MAPPSWAVARTRTQMAVSFSPFGLSTSRGCVGSMTRGSIVPSVPVVGMLAGMFGADEVSVVYSSSSGCTPGAHSTT